jgi:hypothetical protein
LLALHAECCLVCKVCGTCLLLRECRKTHILQISTHQAPYSRLIVQEWTDCLAASLAMASGCQGRVSLKLRHPVTAWDTPRRSPGVGHYFALSYGASPPGQASKSASLSVGKTERTPLLRIRSPSPGGGSLLSKKRWVSNWGTE